jgi:hypothetical protein
MKTTILAAIVALATGSAMVAPTQAASITITTGESGHVDDGWHDNGLHRGWYKQRMHRGWYHGMQRREVVRDCEVMTTRHWRHGRLIIERTRDCRY